MDKKFNIKVIGLVSLSIFFLIFLLWFFIFNSLNIKSTTPVDGATQVSLDSPILIIFEKSLTENQLRNLRITSNPSFGYSPEWSKENNTVTLKPTGRFESSTKYQVRANIGGKSYSWSFTTTDENKDDYKTQGESDKYFSDQEKNFNTSHPWYNNLPHRTRDFFVGFDPLKNEFYADLYTVEKTEDEIKNEVLSYLRSIGVNTNNYKVVFTAYNNRP